MITILTVTEKNKFSRFSPFKWIRNLILPFHKVDQGQHRIIICANLVRPLSQMLPAKSLGLSVPQEKILKGFNH